MSMPPSSRKPGEEVEPIDSPAIDSIEEEQSDVATAAQKQAESEAKITRTMSSLVSSIASRNPNSFSNVSVPSALSDFGHPDDGFDIDRESPQGHVSEPSHQRSRAVWPIAAGGVFLALMLFGLALSWEVEPKRATPVC